MKYKIFKYIYSKYCPPVYSRLIIKNLQHTRMWAKSHSKYFVDIRTRSQYNEQNRTYFHFASLCARWKHLLISVFWEAWNPRGELPHFVSFFLSFPRSFTAKSLKHSVIHKKLLDRVLPRANECVNDALRCARSRVLTLERPRPFLSPGRNPFADTCHTTCLCLRV